MPQSIIKDSLNMHQATGETHTKIHITGSHSTSMRKEHRLITITEDHLKDRLLAMIMIDEDHLLDMIMIEEGHHKVMIMIGGDHLLDMTTTEEVLHLPTTTIDVVLLHHTIGMIHTTVTHITKTSITYQHLLK